MAYDVSFAALSVVAALPKTSIVVNVPVRAILKYCKRYERMLNAPRFAVMFSNRRSMTMADRLGMRHNTVIWD